MKLYQLAFDHKEYGERAGWWLVVSDDAEDELAGPFEDREEAERWIGDDEKKAAIRYANDVIEAVKDSYGQRVAELERLLAEAIYEASCCDDIKLDQPLAGIIADLQKDRERLQKKLRLEEKTSLSARVLLSDETELRLAAESALSSAQKTLEEAKVNFGIIGHHIDEHSFSLALGIVSQSMVAINAALSPPHPSGKDS